MSNRIASITAPAPALPRPITAILLAAWFVAIGGCSAYTAPPLPRQAASYVPDDPPRGTRYRIDPARNRVWILTGEGLSLRIGGSTGKLVEVALPSWQWVDEPYGCPPDLALGPDGEVVVTSNIVSTLWRVDPDSLAVSTHEPVLDADSDKDVGFSGLEYSSEHGMFLAVSDIHGSLWWIDPLLRTAHKVPLSAPIREACVMPETAKAWRVTGLTMKGSMMSTTIGSTQIPGASQRQPLKFCIAHPARAETGNLKGTCHE